MFVVNIERPQPSRGGKEASGSATGSSTVRGRDDSFSGETVVPLHILIFRTFLIRL